MSVPRRGDIWEYQSISHTRQVLVVSADELNELGIPITADVTDVPPTGPAGLLAVPIGGHGYVKIRDLNRADTKRFSDLVARVTPEQQEAIDFRLRSALDL